MDSRTKIPSEKMPIMIGGNENGDGGFASSSRLTLEQVNMMDGEFPSLDVTPNVSDSDIQVLKDEEMDIKSGSENLEPHSGDDQQPKLSLNPRKRKHYHRHTQYQIQEMEAFFKDCPHPDDKKRKQLARDLGLEPLQVKFWFQNKRTQTKTHNDRQENAHLRSENELLRAENIRYRETLSSAACHNCGSLAAISEMSVDEHQLRLENARLRQEIEGVSAIAATFAGKPFATFPVLSSPLNPGIFEQGLGAFGGQSSGIRSTMVADDLLRSLSGPTELNRPLIIEIAVSAMDELVKMAEIDDPLWISSIDRTTYVLNEEEYIRMFPRKIGPKPTGLKAEASREIAVVGMNHSKIIDIFMDLSMWLAVFSSIVSRAMIVDVLSTGAAENYNGAMHVMSAEFQGLSPVVPTRDCTFVRYCKQIGLGTWAAVDVSLDSLIHGVPVARCRRRPSGCVIQEMANSFTKVTWVEHVEVDDRGAHYLSRPLINSGLAYGAKRWISILDRQCERLSSAIPVNLPYYEGLNDMVLTNPQGRKNLLKLSERMVLSFCAGVTSSSAYTWTTVSGNAVDEARIMTRKSINDPGRPSGVLLSSVLSFWLPVPPRRVFEFLRDESTRDVWDILSNGGGHVQEMAQIVNGLERGNCVSLLRVCNGSGNPSNMMILQESSTDSTASFVIYAPVDIFSMNTLLGGGNPDNVALLPSGFTILPSAPNGLSPGTSVAGPSGSLLTIAFQMLIDSAPTYKVSIGSIATVNNLIESTTMRLKAALLG